jgi:uncharacterized membrane-anchored protein YhcB (DUF1043 family)
MEKSRMQWVAGIAIALVLILGVVALALLSANAKKSETISGLETRTEQLEQSVQEVIQYNNELANILQAASDELQDRADALGEAETRARAAEEAVAELEARLETAETTETPVSARAGKVLDGLFLDAPLNVVLDSRDISRLVDGRVRFDGEDYNVHEEFVTLTGNVLVATSLSEDERFGADPRLVLSNRKALVYRFVFDETIDPTKISNDEPLKIDFLGMPIELVKVQANEVTIKTGNELFLLQGQDVVVNGRTVTLVLVGADNAFVDVDGVSKLVRLHGTENINGVNVRLDQVLSNNFQGAAATLVVGNSDVTITLRNNQKFMGQDDFVFNVEFVGGELSALVVSYNERRHNARGNTQALLLGESVVFPNNYLTMLFESTQNTDYVTYSVFFDQFDEDVENVGIVNQNCVVIETDGRNAIEVGPRERPSSVFACVNGKVYYQDTKGLWHEDTFANTRLVNRRSTYGLFMGPLSSLRFIEPTGDFIQLDTNFAGQRLGSLREDAEATDVLFNALSLGTREYDVLTPYGTVLWSPETNADNDEFFFSIPSDRVEATVFVH